MKHDGREFKQNVSREWSELECSVSVFSSVWMNNISKIKHSSLLLRLLSILKFSRRFEGLKLCSSLRCFRLISSHFTFGNDDMKSKRHVTSLLSLIFRLKLNNAKVFKLCLCMSSTKIQFFHFQVLATPARAVKECTLP